MLTGYAESFWSQIQIPSQVEGGTEGVPGSPTGPTGSLSILFAQHVGIGQYARKFLLVIAALVMALSSLQLPALTTAHSQRLFHVLAVLMSQLAHACTLLALEVELPCVIIMHSRLALEAELSGSFAVHYQSVSCHILFCAPSVMHSLRSANVHAVNPLGMA